MKDIIRYILGFTDISSFFLYFSARSNVRMANSAMTATTHANAKMMALAIPLMGHAVVEVGPSSIYFVNR